MEGKNEALQSPKNAVSCELRDMFNTKGLMSSLKQDWKTPKEFYKGLNREFDFDFDPCPANPRFNGLSIEWKECNFVNPPYKEIAKWVQKSYMEWRKGKTVVMLIPSRTDTRWWHDFIMKATEIRFIKGRLCFNDNKKPAPFPSAVIVFKAPKIKSFNWLTKGKIKIKDKD